ncbi:MAG: T9SS type A sorting domain-containing protein [Bacteroidota bacterium]|nr:T9SS type A sorting domain-containing protein [Bacteroidota bacterium]
MKKYLVIVFCFSVFTILSQTTILNPLGDGGFENGTTFAANNWTVAHGGAGTNQWHLGNVVTPACNGARCAYISNTSGTNNNYSTTSSTRVHLYRNVDLTAFVAPITLEFYWKLRLCDGSFDFMNLNRIPIGSTPVNGSAPPSPTVIAGPYGAACPANVWQFQSVNLSAQAGTQFKLDFYFQTGTFAGTQPPPAIDAVYIYQGIPVLSIELKEFTVDLVSSNEVKLNWTTATEKNNKKFVVERSIDGMNFIPISDIAGSGNSSKEINYSSSDYNLPEEEVLYYRLKSIDEANKIQYSRIKYIARTNTFFDMELYPNPSNNLINVKMHNSSNYYLTIYDLMGKIVNVEQIIKDDEITFDVSNLPHGVYITSLKSDSGVKTKHFIKN